MIREDFLHFLWEHQLFDKSSIKTTSGGALVIHNPGQYQQRSGPDFFYSIIEIDKQKWAGNIEIHVKSSDWYVHHHEVDPAYENVILHVVWTHDMGVFRKDSSEIPVLELKKYAFTSSIEKYKQLIKPKEFIYCEQFVKEISVLFFTQFIDRLLIDRLEKKTRPIEALLKQHKNDWEAVFFIWLARGFGLNINGEIFSAIASAIPFAAIRNEHAEVENIEALFFVKAGLLNGHDVCNYQQDLQQRSIYLNAKYNLTIQDLPKPEFFQLRPDNFPTIRLAQLAYLYHRQTYLFSKLIAIDDLEHFYQVFQTDVSQYWQCHYHFGKAHAQRRKRLTKNFIDLLLINTIIPFKFAYSKAMGSDSSYRNLSLLLSIKAEKNNIITQFDKIGLPCKNAFESQALLQLKNEFCDKKRCLECQFGISFLDKHVNPVNLKHVDHTCT